MRSQAAINNMLEKLFAEYGDVTTVDKETFTRAAIAVQAISWVLGDELSPAQMIEDEKGEEQW
jgi:hypothetical protein